MQKNVKLSCVLAVLALSWPVSIALALDEASREAQAATSVTGYYEFLQSLWPLAEQKGIRRVTFDLAFAGLTPDPAAPAASNRQAEFDKPLKSYLDEAVSPRRIARGRECLKRWQDELHQIERRFGVPREILLATFGIETDFGKAKGEKDVVRSLATLAYRRQDRPVFRDELISALVMLDKGGVARAAMKGSWAGAMGGPQFLPSAFLKYAVSYAGVGSPDIWNNPLDSLASIANFLRQSGWQPGLSWGTEAILPKNFGFASLHGSFAAFAAQGAKCANGDPFPQGDATLFVPSGAGGPAFLLSANYWILKAYNNSDSYALCLRTQAGDNWHLRGDSGEFVPTCWQRSHSPTLVQKAYRRRKRFRRLTLVQMTASVSMLFSRGRYESGLVTYIRFVLANVRRAQLAHSPGGKPIIKESRKNRTSAGKRASLFRPSKSAKCSSGILPRRLSRQCGASVVAAQDATPTEQRISTMSLKKLSSNKPSRADSKRALVLAMLQRKPGATIATIMKATGWQPHSVRGFLAGVVRTKLGLTLVSEKTGEARVYRIVANDVSPKRKGRPGRKAA